MADLQRKTANLFDADTWYGAYKQADGTYQTNRNTWYTLVAKPFTNDDIGKSFCFAANVEPSSGNARFAAVINGVQINGLYTGNRCIVTFTVQTIDDKIIFDYGSGSTMVTTVSNIMLNTGSQPLPYEPYGWLHSLRKLTTSTDTFTTLPADLYADGNNATVGLVGNMSQTGTPTPQNPIQPSECGERTANLTYGRIDDVNIDAAGTITRLSGFDIAIGRVESGVTYTANTYVFAFYTNEPTIGSVSYNGSRIVTTPGEPSTFTAPITGYVAFRLDPGEPAMLNTGSTALPYEPYGIKIPISSASTTTPVYLGEVETTRKIKKLVLTGKEDWNVYSGFSAQNCYQFNTNITNHDANSEAISTHFTYTDVLRTLIDNDGTFMFDSKKYIRVHISSCTTLEDFTTYLQQQYAAGTPVTVWYVLANEETGIVNEPLMKIGNYADTVSGITIPTIAGKDTFDVDTTLKPSEVELTYTGWHDATVEEWDGSQWN